MPSHAIADDDFIVDTDGIGKSHNGVVRSDQFLELGEQSPNALTLEGEQCLRMGHLDRAIMLFQRTVELAPLDVDARVNYANALEKKLVAQKDRDPALFNFLVKQWLFIMKKAEFADVMMQGRAHLYDLTGKVPTKFESNVKYLQSVLIPTDGSTKVALGGIGDKDKDKDKKKPPKRDPDAGEFDKDHDGF
jgi:hypothetical protein